MKIIFTSALTTVCCGKKLFATKENKDLNFRRGVSQPHGWMDGGET